ncbi:MAG: SLBB domain-containing protein [Phycisphaerales bacterium]|nr:SLBB domain-containing protein [Phycisphaerales bacterium]
MIEQLLRLLSGDLGQRIGWSLLHFLWQGVAVAAVLGVALQVLRSARLRYAAACAAMVALLAMPAITASLISPRGDDVWLYPSNTFIAPLPRDVERAPALSAGISAEGHASAAPELRPQESSQWRARIDACLPWAVLVWLTGVLALSLWHVSGWTFLHRIRRSARPVEGQLAELFQRLLKRLGVRHAVKLLESAAVRTPVVIGFLRPVILFPASTLTGLSAAQIEAILVHELAHVRRWDCLIRMIQAAAETVLFFHPTTWWVSSRITQESENCCDEIAVAICGDREGYAQALAQVAGVWSISAELAAAAGGGKLLPRLQRVLGEGGRHEKPMARTLIGAMVALMVLVVMAVVPWACTMEKEEKDVKSQLVGVWKERSQPPRTVLKADGHFEHKFGLHTLMAEGTWRVVDGKKIEFTIEANYLKPYQTDRRCAKVGTKYELPIQTLTSTELELGPFSYVRETPGKEGGDVFVMGEMERPGVYYKEAGTTLTLKQVLSSTGLTLNEKKEQMVRVWRRDEKDQASAMEWKLAEVLSEKEKDRTVATNDLIIVAEAGTLGKVKKGAVGIVKAAQQGEGEVYVMGKVTRPGVYNVPGFQEATVLQMLVGAGLSLEDIKHATVGLTRRVGEAQEEVIKLDLAKLFDGTEADRFVQRDDLLSVTEGAAIDKVSKANPNAKLAIIAAPKAGEPGEFYIMGKVNRPGSYVKPDRITVRQAVAAAGLSPEDAKHATVQLIRRVREAQEEIITIDLAKVFDGDEADRFLQSGDVLNVRVNAATPPATQAK